MKERRNDERNLGLSSFRVSASNLCARKEHRVFPVCGMRDLRTGYSKGAASTGRPTLMEGKEVWHPMFAWVRDSRCRLAPKIIVRFFEM